MLRECASNVEQFEIPRICNDIINSGGVATLSIGVGWTLGDRAQEYINMGMFINHFDSFVASRVG